MSPSFWAGDARRLSTALAGKSLKHIAQDVGYRREPALSRAFKAPSGSSPREWRKASVSGGF
jgi:AraC-like DNA-binding protein